MRKVLVVAPHPDDETLGCGGTILKHKTLGDHVYWLIATEITEESGWTLDKVRLRRDEITNAARLLDFKAVHSLHFSPAKLDSYPLGDLINGIACVFKQIEPEIIYIPYRGDIHSDHKVVFDAVAACTKWFRHKYIRSVLAYETLSETDFGIDPDDSCFRPNVFVDISDHLEGKIEVLSIYRSELGIFPFPRSIQAVRALAELRGASAGCNAAEAFMLLKHIV